MTDRDLIVRHPGETVEIRGSGALATSHGDGRYTIALAVNGRTWAADLEPAIPGTAAGGWFLDVHDPELVYADDDYRPRFAIAATGRLVGVVRGRATADVVTACGRAMDAAALHALIPA